MRVKIDIPYDSSRLIMMKHKLALLFVFSALSLAVATSPALAQAELSADNDNAFILLAQKKKLTEAEAAKRAQKQYGGKVVGVSCREKDDRVYCSVRLDIDGRIKTVTIRG